MMTPKAIAFELDGKTHAALELLAGEMGAPISALASKIVGQGVWHRINTRRAGLFEEADGQLPADRKTRIATQAQRLARKFNNRENIK